MSKLKLQRIHIDYFIIGLENGTYRTRPFVVFPGAFDQPLSPRSRRGPGDVVLDVNFSTRRRGHRTTSWTPSISSSVEKPKPKDRRYFFMDRNTDPKKKKKNCPYSGKLGILLGDLLHNNLRVFSTVTRTVSTVTYYERPQTHRLRTLFF